MIRIVAVGKRGQSMVLLGLTPENVDRLRAGRPVRVNLRHLDPSPTGKHTDLPDIDVMIFYADDAGIEALKNLPGSPAPKATDSST